MNVTLFHQLLCLLLARDADIAHHTTTYLQQQFRNQLAKFENSFRFQKQRLVNQ